MEILLQEWKEEGSASLKDNLAYLRSLHASHELDLKIQDLHEEGFEKMDCLECANCCKSTPAIVLKSDVKRIAKHLSIPPKTFIRKYLLEDVVGGYVINGVPCTFLQEDNTCSIYEVRPQACRNYPHTDEGKIAQRAKLHAHNTVVCPVVYSIVEHLKTIDI